MRRETLLVEYKEALNHVRALATLMRQDITFVTTVQGAVLAIIGMGFPLRNIAHISLAGLAFFVALVSINSVGRSYKYMAEYMSRIREIEGILGMHLFTRGRAVVGRRVNLSVGAALRIYCGLVVIFWLIMGVISLI